MLNRRRFLRTGSASLIAGMSGFLPTVLSAPSYGANTSGYRAMVCVFLFGGMDNHDTVIPFDNENYRSWEQIRASLLAVQGASRSRDSLRQLAPAEAGFDGRQFALPPELSGLHGLFQSGNAAIVGNVGPLQQPTDASSFNAQTVRLPSRLFSHNDQQATWMSGAPEGARFGWAGLFADIMQRAGANVENTFAAITTGGADLLITGQQTTPYQVVGETAVEPVILEDLNNPVLAMMTRHLRTQGFNGDNLLARDMATRSRLAIDANRRYNQSASQVGGAGDFPGSGLGQQLQAVATAISARESLGVNRQIFTVGLGGFDTHSNQAKELPMLQQELDAAIVAFQASMQAMGLNEQVVLFTTSDFGRTLAINGDGTDHGWGGHHFVVGGGVQGQRIFGGLPPSTLGHSRDAGSGRLVPDVSVEQFAAPLGRWFGLDNSEIQTTFPNLGAFDGELALFA
ncbi:MAG: DUF1501 domain-containing protein [Pseudomonadota bacterium]